MARKLNTEKYERFKEIAKRIGLFNLNHSQIARELELSDTAIKHYLKKYIRENPKEAVLKFKSEAINGMETAIGKVRIVLLKGNNKEQLEAARTFADLNEKAAKILESYGLKEKEAEKLKIEGTINLKEIIKKWKK